MSKCVKYLLQPAFAGSVSTATAGPSTLQVWFSTNRGPINLTNYYIFFNVPFSRIPFHQ